MMINDFHTHTSLSDGVLSPMEMLRRAAAKNYNSIGLTDHASSGDLERIVGEIIQVCALARKHWKILAVPGVELTHVPVQAIAQTAKRAKELGAWIVVVHGETIVEPVEKGTNLAAIRSSDVDILAHPGLITPEEVRLATEKGKFLEISARRGHSLTNGHVARLAELAGTKLLVDSDAHTEDDLLSESFAAAVLRGSGLIEAGHKSVLEGNPLELLNKLLAKYLT
jgi:putative hydrolase